MTALSRIVCCGCREPVAVDEVLVWDGGEPFHDACLARLRRLGLLRVSPRGCGHPECADEDGHVDACRYDVEEDG